MPRKDLTGLKLLFGHKYDKWSYNEEQLSYVTPAYISKKISSLIYETYSMKNQNIISEQVWDMFGGIGVDCVHLARYFSIISTEIDKNVYHLLVENVSFHKLRNVILINDDCTTYLEKIHPDIIYFDPPWGDTYDSSQFSFSNVKLPNGIPVTELAQTVYNMFENVVIKCPLNSNTFDEQFKEHIAKIIIFKKHKLKFIFLN